VDFGKQIRNLFELGYTDEKSISVDFNNSQLIGSLGHEIKYGARISGPKVKSGSISIMHLVPKWGLVSQEMWQSDSNRVLSALTFSGHFAREMDFTLSTASTLSNTSRSLSAIVDYRASRVNLHGEVSLSGNPIFNVHGAFAHNGWQVGGCAQCDVGRNTLSRSSMALGYNTQSGLIYAHVSEDFGLYGFGFYNKVCGNLEVAGKMGWNAVDNSTRTAIAMKYVLGCKSRVQAKMSPSEVALAYGRQLTDDISISLTAKLGTMGGIGVGFAMGKESSVPSPNDCYQCY